MSKVIYSTFFLQRTNIHEGANYSRVHVTVAVESGGRDPNAVSVVLQKM